MSPLTSTTHPLILTLTLDNSTQHLLTSLRTKYFPPHRNHLHAHLTLFHAIPPRRLPELESRLHQFCQRPGFDVVVSNPKKMGIKGVMIGVESVKPKYAIEGIHRALLSGMKKDQDDDKEISGNNNKEGEGKLTNQDLMKLAHPHVTVLNKAESDDEVEKCLEEVERMFKGMEGGEKRGRAVGFQLWEYLGGPWKPFKQFWFKGEGEHHEQATNKHA